jgi:hypothetical protein
VTSTETNHWPGEVTLQLGDVVQKDGGRKKDDGLWTLEQLAGRVKKQQELFV